MPENLGKCGNSGHRGKFCRVGAVAYQVVARWRSCPIKSARTVALIYNSQYFLACTLLALVSGGAIAVGLGWILGVRW
jgi:hypothetical protein